MLLIVFILFIYIFFNVVKGRPHPNPLLGEGA